MNDPVRPPIKVLSWRWVLAGGVFVAVVIVVVLAVLWHVAGNAPADGRAAAQIDAIKTALGAGAGTGGGVALLLAARRQWLSERAQAYTEEDSAERRITELYTTAVDQLGSEKAAVRLGGLYALERLGHDHTQHGQTVVDVMCAYLRMPYEPEDDPESRQEIEVRMTGQRLLNRRLRNTSTPLDLDLSGAALFVIDFSRAVVNDARFVGTDFHGGVIFEGARFRHADFSASRTDGPLDGLPGMHLGAADDNGWRRIIRTP